MKEQNKSLKKNIILNIIKTFMGLVFPLISFPYVSRILNPDGIGKVNFSRSIVAYFSMIAALGIKTYGIREGAKVRNNQQQLNLFAQELFIINIISTIIAYSLFFLFTSSIPMLHTYKSLLYVWSLTIFFETVGLEWLYVAKEDYAYITIRSILFQCISLGLLLVFVKKKEDFIYYAGISVFASVGANILNFIHSRKYVSLIIRQPLHLKKHLKPIFILFSMTVTISVYTILDTTMLGFLTNDYQVGLYSASTKINRIVLSIVTSIGTVLMPRLSYYVGQKDEAEFKNLAYKSFEAMFMLAIPCAVGLSIVATPTILLFSGKNYMEAIPVMRIMNPIIVIIGLGSLLGSQIFIPMGKEKYTLISVIVGAISNFTLNLILIPHYQAIGAATATVLAETFVTSTQLFFARKIFKLRNIFSVFLRYFLCSSIMAVIIYFPSVHIQNPVKNLLCTICLGIIIYFTLLIITKNQYLFSIINNMKKKLKFSDKNDIM